MPILSSWESLAALWSDGGKWWVDKHPYILESITAYIDSLPKEGHLGKPKETLKQLMEELDSQEFGPLFQEFCKRECIYGFGDVQVKRMYDELLKSWFHLGKGGLTLLH